MPSLYYPGADWRTGSSYPEVKPDSDLELKDHLRLAWEVLRRMPRYRWHYQRLLESGLLGTKVFKGQHYFFSGSEGRFFRVPEWKSICLDDHFCKPFARPKQLLEDYVDEHSGKNWVVVHGNRWALKIWGVSEIADPRTPYDALDLERLFAPSFPTLLPEDESTRAGVLDPDGGDAPIPFHFTLDRRELAVRLRLDMPAKAQMREIYELLLDAQKESGLAEVNDGARGTDLGFSSFWLRTWDASQEAWEQENSTEICASSGNIRSKPLGEKWDKGGRLPRTEIVSRIEAEIEKIPAAVLSRRRVKNEKPRVKGKGTKERALLEPVGVEVTFLEELEKAVAFERVDKWKTRARGYIEGTHKFYRRILALSLEHSASKSKIEGRRPDPSGGTAPSSQT
jgi:hypothetical protein